MAKRLNVNILDSVEYLCNQQGCKITNENGEPVYRDEGHLRNSFVEQHAGFLDRTLNFIEFFSLLFPFNILTNK